jgi:hypothetical protein
VVDCCVNVGFSMRMGVVDWRTHHANTKLARHSCLPPGLEQGAHCWTKTTADAKHVWAIRVRLEIADNHRDLALFSLAIDSKLRGCDLVCLKVADVFAAGQVKERASIIQSKPHKPVRFEITDGTRKSALHCLGKPLMIGSEHFWPGRFHERLHISTRQ